MYDKKYLKSLYNLNQDLKKIFGLYYIFPDGIIIGKDESKKGTFALSFIYTTLCKQGYVILVDSKLLFEIFKHYKMSQIYGLEVRDLKIGAVVNDEFIVFAIYQPLNDNLISRLETGKMYLYENYENELELSDDVVTSLYNKAAVNVYIGDRRVILCKAVMPTLKKNSKIKLQMKDKIENNIFYSRLNILNGGTECTIYHVFRCLNV